MARLTQYTKDKILSIIELVITFSFFYSIDTYLFNQDTSPFVWVVISKIIIDVGNIGIIKIKD
ncbi:hypothetical protein [Poseidonibacter sp.]|uniref:hypothetical protein n=1 Tax=Poseidonibacter sp. TaxID=2321188 RepID=UPI003C707AEE